MWSGVLPPPWKSTRNYYFCVGLALTEKFDTFPPFRCLSLCSTTETVTVIAKQIQIVRVYYCFVLLLLSRGRRSLYCSTFRFIKQWFTRGKHKVRSVTPDPEINCINHMSWSGRKALVDRSARMPTLLLNDDRFKMLLKLNRKSGEIKIYIHFYRCLVCCAISATAASVFECVRVFVFGWANWLMRSKSKTFPLAKISHFHGWCGLVCGRSCPRCVGIQWSDGQSCDRVAVWTAAAHNRSDEINALDRRRFDIAK